MKLKVLQLNKSRGRIFIGRKISNPSHSKVVLLGKDILVVKRDTYTRLDEGKNLQFFHRNGVAIVSVKI